MDYYRVAGQNTDLMQGGASLPKPYNNNNPYRQPSVDSMGRPLPPHMIRTQGCAAMAAAASGEEVLDEFPVPMNIHVAPRATDMSIEQKSFLQMQNAINQSSRIDELLMHNN